MTTLQADLELPRTELDSVAAGFRAIGTTNEILATRPESLAAAVRIARGHLDALDAACSRFRSDSELSRLAEAALASDAVAYPSPLFLDYLRAALHGARISDGLVDFTVGAALISTGYNVDIETARSRTGFDSARSRVPGWQQVRLEESGRLQVPRGTVLDFGATAKAHAADMIARLLAMQLPGGFLVNLGGDIATSGAAPEGGWAVGVEAADGTERQVVTITDQAMTTSSTQLRTWRTDAGQAHHIIDPRTGGTAEVVWAQVSCVSTTALEANTASTASLVLGEAAIEWLEDQGIPARLERRDGSVAYTAGWPADEWKEDQS